MKKKKPTKDTGIMLVINYFVFFAVNYLILHFANYFYPENVVLGTQHISRTWALIHSMGTLALINAFMIPVLLEIEKIKGRALTHKEWIVKFYLINFVGVWLITRLADNLGLGISSWTVAAILAIFLSLAQGFAIMKLKKINS